MAIAVFLLSICALFSSASWRSTQAHAQIPNWACQTQNNCKSVFIAHDSWHAAIVLPKSDLAPDAVPEIGDFPQAQFIEFSWGDKDYFPNPEAGVFTAIKAAFWSSGSVLHVVGVRADLRDFYRSGKIVELHLSAPAHARLQDFIGGTFSRRGTSRAQANAGLFENSRFYPATHRFSLAKTCNTWVAEALAAAGLPVAPSYVLTAGQLAEQIGKLVELP
jgi:uncharacterized protein (TIGR02117 family)